MRHLNPSLRRLRTHKYSYAKASKGVTNHSGIKEALIETLNTAAADADAAPGVPEKGDSLKAILAGNFEIPGMIKLTEKERIAEDIRARKEIKQKLIDSQNAKADRLSKARQKLVSAVLRPRENKLSDGGEGHLDESG